MLRETRPRAPRAEIAVLVALAAWGLFPLLLLLIHAGQLHAHFTGADGLIGADGELGADQLQYLAWTRDAGAHGLASDLFSLAPSGHVYLQPMLTISGLLWRLGLSLPLAYLLWKPVGLVVMSLAAFAWARRTMPESPEARAAVMILALFLYTPATALFSWTGLGAGPFRFQLYLLGDELLAANKLWGYVPSALGLTLVAVALLAAERALDSAPVGHTRAQAGTAGVRRRAAAVAALAALIASWLHPWQGVTLIVIFVGLTVWQRFRRWPALVVPAVAAALPLAYYYLLARTDRAWKLASHYEVIARLPALVLLAGLGPLALVAAAGWRRPGQVVIEQALLLWIAACFVTYFANDAFAPHALQGLSFPLAVLAVRGWRRLRLPAALGAVGIALVTVPGLAYDARKFVNVARSAKVQYYVARDDARALAWVDSAAPAGGVMAPTPFATVVPAQTGRAVWIGDGYWSRDYIARASRVDRLFDGRMGSAVARAFILETGASLLVADCAHRADLSRVVPTTLASSVHRFGCARVYVLTRAGGRSASR